MSYRRYGVLLAVLVAAGVTSPAATYQEGSNAEHLAALERRIKGREERPAEEVFENIALLKGRPASRLPGMMRALTGLLGVDCGFCHVPTRWESDEKAAKTTARRHFAMQAGMNRDYFGGTNAVTCWTCHKGQPKPESLPPQK